MRRKPKHVRTRGRRRIRKIGQSTTKRPENTASINRLTYVKNETPRHKQENIKSITAKELTHDDEYDRQIEETSAGCPYITVTEQKKNIQIDMLVDSGAISAEIGKQII